MSYFYRPSSTPWKANSHNMQMCVTYLWLFISFNESSLRRLHCWMKEGTNCFNSLSTCLFPHAHTLKIQPRCYSHISYQALELHRTEGRKGYLPPTFSFSFMSLHVNELGRRKNMFSSDDVYWPFSRCACRGKHPVMRHILMRGHRSCPILWVALVNLPGPSSLSLINTAVYHSGSVRKHLCSLHFISQMCREPIFLKCPSIFLEWILISWNRLLFS